MFDNSLFTNKFESNETIITIRKILVIQIFIFITALSLCTDNEAEVCGRPRNYLEAGTSVAAGHREQQVDDDAERPTTTGAQRTAAPLLHGAATRPGTARAT